MMYPFKRCWFMRRSFNRFSILDRFPFRGINLWLFCTPAFTLFWGAEFPSLLPFQRPRLNNSFKNKNVITVLVFSDILFTLYLHLRIMPGIRSVNICWLAESVFHGAFFSWFWVEHFVFCLEYTLVPEIYILIIL